MYEDINIELFFLNASTGTKPRDNTYQIENILKLFRQFTRTRWRIEMLVEALKSTTKFVSESPEANSSDEK